MTTKIEKISPKIYKVTDNTVDGDFKEVDPDENK